MGDERASAYTCANQALISRLHTWSSIGANANAAPHSDSRQSLLCPEENTFVFEDHDSRGEGYGRIDKI
jgi:hypothetical protein